MGVSECASTRSSSSSYCFTMWPMDLWRGTDMKLPSAPREACVSTAKQRQGDTGLHWHWLVLARKVSEALFVLTIVVFLTNTLGSSYLEKPLRVNGFCPRKGNIVL